MSQNLSGGPELDDHLRSSWLVVIFDKRMAFFGFFYGKN
jgi:hypothetical protein